MPKDILYEKIFDCHKAILNCVQNCVQGENGSISWPKEMIAALKEKKCLEGLLKYYIEQKQLEDKDSSFFYSSFMQFFKWATFYCEVQDPDGRKGGSELFFLQRPDYLLSTEEYYSRMVQSLKKKKREYIDRTTEESILTSTNICKAISNHLDTIDKFNYDSVETNDLKEFLNAPWIFRPECCPKNGCDDGKHEELFICWSTDGEKLFICSSQKKSDDNEKLREKIIELIKKDNKLKYNCERKISKDFGAFIDMCFFFKYPNDKTKEDDDFSHRLSHYIRLPITGMSYAKAEVDLAIKMPPPKDENQTQILARFVSPLKTILAIIPAAIIAEFSFNYVPLSDAVAKNRSQEWDEMFAALAHELNYVVGPFKLAIEKSLMNSNEKSRAIASKEFLQFIISAFIKYYDTENDLIKPIDLIDVNECLKQLWRRSILTGVFLNREDASEEWINDFYEKSISHDKYAFFPRGPSGTFFWSAKPDSQIKRLGAELFFEAVLTNFAQHFITYWIKWRNKSDKREHGILPMLEKTDLEFMKERVQITFSKQEVIIRNKGNYVPKKHWKITGTEHVLKLALSSQFGWKTPGEVIMNEWEGDEEERKDLKVAWYRLHVKLPKDFWCQGEQ